MLRTSKYILPGFQNKTQSVKFKSFFYWFQKYKDGNTVKRKSNALLKKITSKSSEEN